LGKALPGMLHRHLGFRAAIEKPNNVDLDSITYAGKKSGMCRTLRIPLKKFSFGEQACPHRE
jgi:hypothetical protein